MIKRIRESFRRPVGNSRAALKAAGLIAGVLLMGAALSSCIQPPDMTGGSRDFPDAGREIFLINGLAETVSVIDAAGFEIRNDVILTGIWPNGLWYDSAGTGDGDGSDTELYLVNSGENTITRYNEDSFEVEDELYLGSGQNPWQVIHHSGTTTAYIPCFVSGQVAVADLSSMSGTAWIDVGTAPQGGVYAGPSDGSDGKVYICNTAYQYSTSSFGQGTVSAIDTSDTTDTPYGSVTATINVSKNPQTAIALPPPSTLAANDSPSRVHVICTGENEASADDGAVEVVNVSSDSVENTISIGGSPGSYAVDTDNQVVYLAGVGGLYAYSYDPSTGASDETDVLHDSAGPMDIDAEQRDFLSGVVWDDPNAGSGGGTGYLYITNFSKDEVIVVDVTGLDSGNPDNYSVVGRLETGDGPQSPVLSAE